MPTIKDNLRIQSFMQRYFYMYFVQTIATYNYNEQIDPLFFVPSLYVCVCFWEYVCVFASLFFRLYRRALEIKPISEKKKKQILYKNNIRSSFVFESKYIYIYI